MPALSPIGGDLPNNIVPVDWKISSFTIPGASTGSPYVIPNSTKTFKVNSALNALATALIQINLMEFSAGDGPHVLMYKVTTNSTDTPYIFLIQYSTDNGASWTTGASLAINTPVVGEGEAFMGSLAFTVAVTTPATSDQVLLRLAVSDAISPTTDAFTITDIRVTALCMIIK